MLFVRRWSLGRLLRVGMCLGRGLFGGLGVLVSILLNVRCLVLCILILVDVSLL